MNNKIDKEYFARKRQIKKIKEAIKIISLMIASAGITYLILKCC